MRPFIFIIAVAFATFANLVHAQTPSTRNSPPDFARNIEQMAGGFFGESDAERAALENVPIDSKEERRIGDSELQNYLQSLKQRRFRIVERGRDVDYIASLVKQIQPHMQKAKQYASIRVYIAESQETDARAFPGGSIVVMTGMIEFAQSEAALVGVLGHELSHIDHGHQLRMARAAELAKNGFQSGNMNSQNMQQNIMLMAKNFAHPFRAEDEAAADRDGAKWAFELGYDPLELAKLFERLDKRSGQRGPNQAARMPSFLLTHPSYDNRLAAIREWSAQLQAGRPVKKPYIGRTNLEKRIPRTEREFAE